MFGMKRVGLVFLVTMLAFPVFVSAQVPGKPGESVKQQLTQITAEWLNAERTDNVAFLEKMFAPDYVVMTSAGAILTKPQMLEYLKSSGVKMTYLHSDVVEVRSYGNVALYIDRTTIKGEANGKPFDRVVRFVRVFVKQPGGWQVEYAQASPLRH